MNRLFTASIGLVLVSVLALVGGTERALAGPSSSLVCRSATLRDGKIAVSQGSTMVTFTALRSANAAVFDSIVLHDPNGAILDPGICRVVPPSNATIDGKVNGPVFIIDGTPAFSIAMSGSAVALPEPLGVTIIRKAETRALRLEAVTPALVGTVVVGRQLGELSFSGSPIRATSITQTRESSHATYRLVASETTAATSDAVSLHAFSTASKSVLREMGPRGSVWSISLRSTNARGSAAFHSSGIAVVAGDQLVVVYGGWSGKSGEPELWLDRKSDGRLDHRIALRPGVS